MKPRHAILLAMAITPNIIHAAPAKLLDALKWEESKNKRHEVNYNHNGTRDLGPYQLNSVYLDDFAWRYNRGKKIDPFNERQARYIAGRHIDHLQTALIGDRIESQFLYHHSMLKESVIAWNCGLTRYRQGAPKRSIDFASRVMKRAGMGL